MPRHTFDNIWEDIYAAGHVQYYPWDNVVSFVFNHRPADLERPAVRILEVGCGTGSNLWFAAREGFQVAGIDGSPSAIKLARSRFDTEGLQGEFHVMDFTHYYPWPANTFDLIIDRAALSCCGYTGVQKAIGEIYRVLKPSGKFLFNTYSDKHGSAACGKDIGDGLRDDIDAGGVKGVGQISFWDKAVIEKTFNVNNWIIVEFEHILRSSLQDEQETQGMWHLVVEKK